MKRLHPLVREHYHTLQQKLSDTFSDVVVAKPDEPFWLIGLVTKSDLEVDHPFERGDIESFRKYLKSKADFGGKMVEVVETSDFGTFGVYVLSDKLSRDTRLAYRKSRLIPLYQSFLVIGLCLIGFLFVPKLMALSVFGELSRGYQAIPLFVFLFGFVFMLFMMLDGIFDNASKKPHEIRGELRQYLLNRKSVN